MKDRDAISLIFEAMENKNAQMMSSVIMETGSQYHNGKALYVSEEFSNGFKISVHINVLDMQLITMKLYSSPSSPRGYRDLPIEPPKTVILASSEHAVMHFQSPENTMENIFIYGFDPFSLPEIQGYIVRTPMDARLIPVLTGRMRHRFVLSKKDHILYSCMFKYIKEASPVALNMYVTVNNSQFIAKRIRAGIWFGQPESM